jgi:hypothetical protein
MDFNLLYSQNDNSENVSNKSEFDEERVSKDASKFFREIVKNTSSDASEIIIKGKSRASSKGKLSKK